MRNIKLKYIHYYIQTETQAYAPMSAFFIHFQSHNITTTIKKKKTMQYSIFINNSQFNGTNK